MQTSMVDMDMQPDKITTAMLQLLKIPACTMEDTLDMRTTSSSHNSSSNSRWDIAEPECFSKMRISMAIYLCFWFDFPGYDCRP